MLETVTTAKDSIATEVVEGLPRDGIGASIAATYSCAI
jgi:hypothetical protein